MIANDHSIAQMLSALAPNRVIRGPRQIQTPTLLDDSIYSYIQKCHNAVVGHGGVERTLTKLVQLVSSDKHWPTMRRDVSSFIKQCPCCIFMQPSKRLISAAAPYNMSVSYPNDRVNIDTCGPFPPDENGNTYIIAIMDVFSR